jgi:hypothetical protein
MQGGGDQRVQWEGAECVQSRMAVAQRGSPTPITQALAFSMFGLFSPCSCSHDMRRIAYVPICLPFSIS